MFKRVALGVTGSVAVFLVNAPAIAKSTEMKAEKPNHAWFGVIAKDAHLPADHVHHNASDVRLVKVIHGSPAQVAGLRAGDVIWKFGNERIHNAAQLAHEIRSERPGKAVPVEIFRQGKREDLKVELGSHRNFTA